MNRKLIIIPIMLLIVFGVGREVAQRRQDEDSSRVLASGTVEATDAQLGFQVPGRLIAVHAREGDRVEAGSELAVLDRREAAARRKEAEARVRAARAVLDELESGFRPEEIAQLRAAVAGAEEQLADAQRDLERTRKLFEGGALPQEAVDKVESGAEIARRRVEETRERLRILEKGPRSEKIEAQRSLLAQAEATLDVLDVASDERAIEAPFSGLITVRHRGPGEIVAPGSPVLTLLDPENRWVRIYLPENRLGAVRLGGEATIFSDTFPDRRYRGEIVFVATEAEFTPKSVQTSEERVRLVYAVKVRILEDPNYELKPGLPVDVEIDLQAPPDAEPKS